MGHRDAGALVQHFAGQMGGAASACAAVGHATGNGLGVVLQLGHGVDAQLGVGRDHQDGVADLANRREVLDRVERHLGIDVGVDHQRAVIAEQQGVAVRFGSRNHLGTDVAGRAGLVFHHHLLAQLSAELLSHDAGTGVGHASSSEGHDQADRLVGVFALRMCGGQAAGGQGHGRAQKATAGLGRECGVQIHEDVVFGWLVK